uniref:Phosphoribosyltransferase domain-containing protein n=1 Tax=Euplotes harpa TaxID=151035 RepID=A0A7S3JH00_9SPIT|mmetsp:Transcript_40404/g.46364  ORF Transcript_40404/g.46364 Transcript_40404/m.46364 type:complete len:232 (+) Transcript_40404:46-741(+)
MDEPKTYSPEGFNCVNITEDMTYDKNLFLMPDEDYEELENILIPEGLIKSRIDKLAQQIYKQYRSNKTNPLQIFVIMNGAFQFFSDLQSSIKKVREFSGERIEYDTHFLKIKGYVGTESKLCGIEESVLPESMIRGYDILIVEDIYDSGTLMSQLLGHITQYDPRSVKTAVLIHKCNPLNLKHNFKADFTGFTVPGYSFCVGYGMDYNEHFRDISHVCSVSKEGIEKYKGF